MTESEHHSHRTDEEWRAKIRAWAERLRKDTMNMTQYLYPDLTRVIGEMEQESKITQTYMCPRCNKTVWYNTDERKISKKNGALVCNECYEKEAP